MNENKFFTIEEYIEDCIQNNSSLGRMPQVKVQVKGETIFFDGDLLIDGNKVISNLDWSAVKAKSAKVINNAVSDYAKLPQCLNGLRGDETLPLPQNVSAFLSKNACERFSETPGGFKVKGNLHLFEFPTLDLSSVEVENCLLLRSDKKVEFCKLPKAKKIMGINPQQVVLPQGRIIAFKELKEKGFGQETCKKLGIKEPKIFEKIIASVKSTLGF